MRLKSRVKGIPHGLKFAQPEVNWSSINVVGKSPSWETLVTAVVAMRNANPHHRDKHRWATDVESVANEVDSYNAKICMDNGWVTYVLTVGAGFTSRPVQRPQLSPDVAGPISTIKKLWAGLKTTGDWLDSGQPPVAIELAEKRAYVCSECPLNAKGEFTEWFTLPAANAIKRQIAKLSERNLTTTKDAQLQVCKACLCPLQLKVHTPMSFIQPHLTDQVTDSLKNGKDCWILSELASG